MASRSNYNETNIKIIFSILTFATRYSNRHPSD
jgi:hypothetical protein